MSVFQDEVNSLIHERRSVKPENIMPSGYRCRGGTNARKCALGAHPCALPSPAFYRVHAGKDWKIRRFPCAIVSIGNTGSGSSNRQNMINDQHTAESVAYYSDRDGRQLTEKPGSGGNMCRCLCYAKICSSRPLLMWLVVTGCRWHDLSSDGKILGTRRKGPLPGMLYIGNYNDALTAKFAHTHTHRTKTNWVK